MEQGPLYCVAINITQNIETGIKTVTLKLKKKKKGR